MTTKEKKPLIVAVGLFVPGTGLTRVFETLFTRLSANYDIHWLGIAYSGPVTKHEHYTLYPNNLTGGDMYGAYAAAGMAIELKAAAVWILNDLYMMKNYSKALTPLKKKHIELLSYVPLDGSIKDEQIIEQVLFLDKLVLYNQWAQDEVAAAIKRYSEKTAAVKFPQLHHVYHGVDSSLFTPLLKNQLAQLKEELFHVPCAGDAIFILNANRYNERKDIDTTLRSFARAWKEFEMPAYLVLHMPGISDLHREVLLNRIAELGIAGRVLLNPLGESFISNEQLCNLYRACSIGINSSLGEGWGLVSFEHAATGAVQVVPAHSAAPETWKNAAVFIARDEAVQLNTNPFLMYRINENELVEQLIVLVNDAVQRNQQSDRCYHHAISGKFSWDTVAEQWMHLLPQQKRSPVKIPVFLNFLYMLLTAI